MDKRFLQATLKVNGDIIEFIASDETLDRQGEVIPIDSWDLRNYKKNPVLLVNHDYKVENIVGKATKLRIEGKQLKFNPVFHGLTQLAIETEAMVREGLLNTVSVGFLPQYPKKNGDKIQNELLEISFVPVPANPSASRIGKALEDMAGKAVEEEKIKEFITPDEEPEPEVVPEEKAPKMEIQTLILSKDKFETLAEAKKWVTDHDFHASKSDETTDSWRFRQLEPEVCEDNTFRTIDVTDGVKAVVCRTNKGVCDFPVNMPISLLDEILASNEKLQKALIKATPKEATAGRSQKGPNIEIAILKHLAKEINGALYKSKRSS